MDTNTKYIIDELFQRLVQAEQQNPVRDQAAQSQIDKHLVAHPAAPYYMAQTMIMQEATIKQLHAQVTSLQQQLQHTQKPSGGFLDGLFGGHHAQPTTNGWQPNSTQPGYQQPNYGPQNQPYNTAPNRGYSGEFSRGGSFLGGALQTAAGVAGGMVLGDMMMNMFSHHRPEEIVNIINEQPTPDVGDTMDPTARHDQQDGDFIPSDMTNHGMDDADFGTGIDNGHVADTGFDSTNNGLGDNGLDSPFSDNNDSGFFDGGSFDDGGFDDFDDFS